MGAGLTVDPGDWIESPQPTLAYQWLRCDAISENCAPILGAIRTTYALVAADENSTIRVAVTGTNIQGTATATSAQTAVVTPALARPTTVEIVAAQAAPVDMAIPDPRELAGERRSTENRFKN